MGSIVDAVGQWGERHGKRQLTVKVSSSGPRKSHEEGCIVPDECRQLQEHMLKTHENCSVLVDELVRAPAHASYRLRAPFATCWERRGRLLAQSR